MNDKFKKVLVLVIFLAVLAIGAWYMYTKYLLNAE